jgi:hypothetical protein
MDIDSEQINYQRGVGGGACLNTHFITRGGGGRERESEHQTNI